MTRDLWTEQYEAAFLRFVAGEDDRETFTVSMRKLGFSSQDITLEIDNAIRERAELAAYEAAVAYYGRLAAGDRQC